MRCGIIDIGSNTIHGVGYQISTNRAVKIMDKLVKSHIIRETVDNRLSESGITRLIAVISKLKSVLRSEGCRNIDCIATASMRNLENIDEIIKIVLDATATEILVLSEYEEIKYDFNALRTSIPERSAVGLDLGGGSCQLMQFEGNKILFSKSYPLGSYKITRQFVSGIFPNSEERKLLDFYVKNELMGVRNLFGSRYLYAIGGTAKSILRLYNKLSHTSGKNFLETENLEFLSNLPDNNPQQIYETISDIIKSRPETIIPGTVIVKAMCEILKVDGIYVLSCSVRDGYLIQQIKEKYQ